MLEDKRAWLLDKVRSKSQIMSEARKKGKLVHFGSLMELCSEKHSEQAAENRACIFDGILSAVSIARRAHCDLKDGLLLYLLGRIELRLSLNSNSRRRRRADRATALQLAIKFHTLDSSEQARQQTILHVAVRSPRNRDRRLNPIEGARLIFSSLRSYLMALEVPPIMDGTPGMKPSVIEQLTHAFFNDSNS